MGRKALIFTVSFVLAMIAGAVAVYAWDSGYDGKIADGVTIGGIDVGGMDARAARSQIRTNLVKPLDKPVKVEAPAIDDRFKLDPDEIDIRADFDRMIGEALRVSSDGGVVGRSFRRLTGGELDHDVAPRIAYSKRSVEQFVARLKGKIDRAPVDASVEPSAAGIDPVPSREGLDLSASKLLREVEGALQDPGDRTVKAQIKRMKPEVTTEDLADQYASYIVVDRGNFKLRYYENLELVKTYTIALGKIGHDTPSGLYHIQNKQIDPVWNVPNSEWAGKLAGKTIPPGPDNPLKARWMGIYNGVGIHGTADEASLGSNASHGCIRMSVLDVTDLYDRVPTGSPIYIS